MSSTRRRLIPPVATGVVVTCLVLSGCTSNAAKRAAPDLASVDEEVLGHVHGLGVDPTDDALYVASHFGVFRVEDGERERVADRWQDTMGFVVVGPSHFLGSGHPDPREGLPTSLGLVESTDAGKTWEPVSLMGEADLHSIEVVGARIYAYDSSSESLLVTDDGQRWDTIAQLLPLLDLAVNPEVPDSVYATTREGELLHSADRAAPTPVYDAPRFSAIDWEAQGPLVGVGRGGAVLVSPDGRSGWEEVGSLDGPAQALDVVPGRWHAATQSGIYESTDDGATWTMVLERRISPDETE